jgi:hypothetical protein
MAVKNHFSRIIFTSCITTSLILLKTSNASPVYRLQSLKNKQTTSVKVITENNSSDFYNTELIVLSYFVAQLKMGKNGKQKLSQIHYGKCFCRRGNKKFSQVNLWWKKDFSGSAEKLNDKFKVLFGEPSFVDFVVSEFVPGKKLVWKVIDCYLPWFQDKKEWNTTEVDFQLSEEKW